MLIKESEKIVELGESMTFDEAMDEIAAEYPEVMAGVEIKLQRIGEQDMKKW